MMVRSMAAKGKGAGDEQDSGHDGGPDYGPGGQVSGAEERPTEAFAIRMLQLSPRIFLAIHQRHAWRADVFDVLPGVTQLSA